MNTYFSSQEPPGRPFPPTRSYARPTNWWPLTFLLTSILTLGTMILAVFFAPALAVRWRQAEDRAAADAAYLKRLAELRADAEMADKNLQVLDQRFHLVSLGFREVSRKIAPVVVHISNEIEVASGGSGRTFYDFDSDRRFRERAEGSGVLIQPGYVLTNHHVVRNAERLRITFASGRWVTVAPDAVASDRLTDLAVIHLPPQNGTDLQPDYALTADLADSDKEVQVGDWVLAAGSPFGLRQTVTAGIISAKGRVELGILNQVELLQTDAAVNPGNSGGPLFDQRGRVVGINVAIASDTGRNQGIAFAIPSNTIQEVFKQLVEKGEVQRGYLGVGIQDMPAGLEKRLGVGETGGVIITEVEADSPADQGGIRPRDVLVRYNHEPVGPGNAVGQLRQRIARTAPETTVPVEIVRRGERLTVDVTIAKRKDGP
jgi:S1-C subfamily serine protease